MAAWHALPAGTGYKFRSELPGFEGPAKVWVESLLPAGDENEGQKGLHFLGTYQGGPFAGQGVLSERATGSGLVYYLGFYPTHTQASALVAYLARRSGIDALPGLPEGVLAIRRGEGRVLLNFNEEERGFNQDGEEITLPRRDVFVKGFE